MMHDIAELVSLAATAPCVIGAIAVVIVWGRPAWENRATDWIMTGIVVSFIGQTGDNLYWAIAWTASYLSHDLTDVLFQSGVYSNVPFRQGCGTVAAYCHLRAFCETAARPGRALQRLNAAAFASAVLGACIMLALWLIR